MRMLRLCLLISVFCLVSVTRVSAFGFNVGGINYNVTSYTDLTVEVGSTPYYNDYLTIPEYVTYGGKTYTVTSIGGNAFGGNAFYDCSNLASITIPESVTSIGDFAFEGCSNLASITIPESVTSIGRGAFRDCSNLASITIPESVTGIGVNAFYGCSNLASITIPESVTSIGSGAFEGTAWYDNQPDGLVYIGKLLYSVKGPSGGNIEVAEGTIGICDNAFINSSLTSITIPESVTSIGDFAFLGCSNLASITIPESVTSIGGNAFKGCSNLASITIPENSALTSIGDCAFEGCSNLASITIPESATSIGHGAFRDCSNLASITIPESVTSIGESAFYGCSNLTSITIPESVTSIGEWAFYGCSNLASITIPESVTSIGSNAFRDCSNLTSITIPENSALTSIGDCAFCDCSNLASITIPESVTSIGSGAFGGTAWYDNQPDGLVYIGKFLYDVKGPSEDNIEVAEGTIGICEYAFFGSYLSSITIPESVTSIGRCAFKDCRSLTSITIPENSALTSIGESAFFDCSSLVSINLPAGVTSIGDCAFMGCSKLVEVTFNSIVPPSFGNKVFMLISANATLNYPDGSDYSVLKRYFSSFGTEFFNGNSWVVEDDGTAYVYPNGSSVLNGYSGTKTIKKVYAYGFNEIAEFAFDNSLIEEIFFECEFGDPNQGLQKIHNYAFHSCINLKAVHISKNIDNNLTHIGGEAFSGCASLSHLYLPEGLTHIGDNAFCNSGIELLVIPESVMYLGEQYGDAVFVLKNLYGATVMEYLPRESIPNIIVPVGAIGYEQVPGGYNTYADNKAYKKIDDKIYIFGYVDCAIQEFEDLLKNENINKIIFTPDAIKVAKQTNPSMPFNIRNLPSTVTLDVIDCSIDDPEFVYTIEGSNAIFIGNNKLFMGYANSIIPYGTKTIASGAFTNCLGLSSIEIPNSVISIASDAFQGCVGVDTIIVDEANPVYDSRENCNAIIHTQSNRLILASKTTTIPSSVTSIGKKAFSSQKNMDVIVPSHITNIEEYAFYDTKNLYFESLTPPTISGDVFGWGAIFVPSEAYESYCNADVWSQYKDRIVTKEMSECEVEVWSSEGMSGLLKEVGLDEADRVVKLKIKGEINSYDITVMRDKMPLLQEIDLSEATVLASKKPFYETHCTGKNSLGSCAFYDLDKLVSVKLPKDLTSLGDFAFWGCDRLKSVDASVTDGLYMGKETFYCCYDLHEFVAPPVISHIGSYCFRDCGNLKEVNTSIIGSISTNSFSKSGIEKFEADSIGGSISSYAFDNCSSLKEVKIGTCGGDLGDYAFQECSELRSVEFTRGPRKIGSNVFVLCSKLENFVAGEGTIEISDEAFIDKLKIYSTNIFGELTYYLSECPRPMLKRVVLPESIQKIGSKAFGECCSLSEISIPQSVTSIGSDAFNGCSSLKSIEIPNGVTAIEYGTFDYCSSLQSVIFPDGLTSIGNGAFAGCGFDTLKLPPRLRTIGESAFAYNSKLTELHIPSSVENIGSNAFNGCDALSAVYTYTVEPTTITETTFSTFNTATLYVPTTSFWNYYWDIGWSKFNHKNFKEFNEPYKYFYINGDYQLDSSTGYITGTPDADLRPGSGLIVTGDESNKVGSMRGEHARLATQRRDGGEATMMRLSNVNMESDGSGNSASVIGDSKLHVDTLNMRIDVKGGKWYFFTFPFDVPFSRITMQGGSGYIFRYYDSAQRAKNGNGGWKIVNDDYLKACQGYIFQSSADDVLILSAENVPFDGKDKQNRLVTYQSSNLHDASWNFIGNPYLSYYDMANLDYTAPVTVWDGNGYVALRPGDDDYCFAPYEAFFVQKPQGKESITFGFDNQMTKKQSLQSLSLRAELRRTAVASPDRQIVNLVFGDEENTDRTRVVFNSRASHDYETACDAAKFETAGIPQFYTIGGESVRYAINERPEGDGVVPIGYSVPNSGYYTIDVVRDDAEVFIYDAETKTVHLFEDGAYRFYSEKGEHNARLSLGIRSKAATEIETVDADDAVIAVEGGIEFKTYANAEVYNSAGMLVATQHGIGVVELPVGTYIVSVGNCNTKVVVK